MSQLNSSQAPAAVDMQAVEKRCADLKTRAGRFRVLIIGRANAGKTTILKKICNTTDNPEIYTNGGQKIDVSEIEPTAYRGLHNVENEMVFRSNPGFVFHDSRGFEAGGVDELKKVNDFVSARSKATKLSDQIHVIWYCIPMDDDRPITYAEKQFFSGVGTGKVPLIAVFTKCETLEIKAISALEEQGYSFDEAMEHALEYVQNNLKNTHLVLQEMKYPPQGHVYLQELNKQEQQCLELVESTATVLDSDILQVVFVSTLQNNLEASMKFSLKWILKEGLKPQMERDAYVPMLETVMIYFPHYTWNLENFKLKDLYKLRREYEKEILSSTVVAQSLEKLLDYLSSPLEIQLVNYACGLSSLYFPTLKKLHHLLALSIIAEHLTIICNQGQKFTAKTVSATIFLYQQSLQCGKVTEAVQKAFSKYQVDISTLPSMPASPSKQPKFKGSGPKNWEEGAKGKEDAATRAREKFEDTLFETIWANQLDK